MSNTNLTSYNFHDSNIRVIQNDKGEVLFCLADVCDTLKLLNPSKMAQQIKDEFGCPNLKLAHLTDSLGRDQECTMITEPQLYFVMIRSRAKVAREFRQWICNEVLPSIRQTGTYSEKKAISKSSWYVREIAEQFIKYGVADNDLFESVIDVTNRAFKQGYAIAISKKERELKDKYILTEEQLENVNQMLKYYEHFRPYLLTVYDKLTKAKEQAYIFIDTIKSLPISKIYDSATASDFNVSSIKHYLELIKK